MRIWIVLFLWVGLMANHLAPLCQPTAASKLAAAADPCGQSMGAAQTASTSAADIKTALPAVALALVLALPIIAWFSFSRRLDPASFTPQLYPPPPR